MLFKLTIEVAENVTETHYYETRELATAAGERAVTLYAIDFHVEEDKEPS